MHSEYGGFCRLDIVAEFQRIYHEDGLGEVIRVDDDGDIWVHKDLALPLLAYCDPIVRDFVMPTLIKLLRGDT